MTRSTFVGADVLLTDDDVATVQREFENIPAQQVERFAAIMSDGETQVLPPELSTFIARTCQALALHGHVTVGALPEDLTSNTAAELLGISRPTLLKLARNGEIDSFKVGSHTRFKRDDVLKFNEQREKARGKVLEELLELGDQLEETT